MVTRRARSTVGLLTLGLALALTQLLGATPALAATPGTISRSSSVVTADGLPSVQIDGVVWAQAVNGTTVYAGGQFTTARSPQGDPKPYRLTRSNLIAYDVTTGRLKGGFKTGAFNGPVRTVAMSSDRTTVYVGGDFTKVGSATRWRFAAFDAATGKLRSLAPRFNTRVSTLLVYGSTVYAGGWFTVVGTTKRTRLAAFNASTGRLTGWHPTSDGAVNALVLTPDKTKVVVGGSFMQLNTTRALGMGALDRATGASRTWKANAVVRNYKNPADTTNASAAVWSLTADADTVYGSGYAYKAGNFEGVFALSPADGAIRWLQDCHGDTYSVAPVGSVVYAVGHAHTCANIGGFPEQSPRQHYRAVAMTKAVKGTVATNSQPGSSYGDFAGQPAPALYNWFPELTAGTVTGMSQAAWSLVAAGGYLAAAGEFTAVNGRPQQGVVRFALPRAVTPAQGPRLTDASTAPTLTVEGTDVTAAWRTNWDRDDRVLRYTLLRDGAPVGAPLSAVSAWWERTTVTATDAGLPAGTYRYAVRATDPTGLSVTSPETSVVVTDPPVEGSSTPGDGAAAGGGDGTPAGG